MRQILLFPLLMTFLGMSAARAEETPRWELGLGLAGLSIPDYRGSDQRRAYLLPLPYVQYRGKFLQIDREGAHGKLFTSAGLRLELSVAAGPPARSEDDGARTGMPDLDPTVEGGVSLQIFLARDAQRGQAWSVQLPWRAVVATDFTHAEAIGWIFAPSLNYDRIRLNGWNLSAAAGPLYASEEYHDYYYEVAPQHATAARPVYDAARGYSGSRLTLSTSRRFPRFWAGAFARYDRLSGATFEDSPLVKKQSSFMAGAGIAWILAAPKP